MNRTTHLLRQGIVAVMSLLASLLLAGCIFEVPITAEPTRKVNEKWLGNWVSIDGEMRMSVRKLDGSIYIVALNGDLFRVWHSDLDNAPYLSAQDLNSPERKWTYLSWQFAENEQRLTFRVVSEEVVPAATPSIADVQALLRSNATTTELFEEEPLQFTREKPARES